MKKILLLGDSVRKGYDQYVRESFDGIAEVYYPTENCRFAQYILRCFNTWTEELRIDRLDAVHWNAGLWDTLRIYGDDCLTPLDEYIRYLHRIQSRIERLFPSALSIFATSTPVRESGFIPEFEMRYNADIEAYNTAAAEALGARGVIVNDLYALMKDAPDALHSDQTHYYTAAATEALGSQVNTVLCDALGIEKAALARPDASKFEQSGTDDRLLYELRGNKYEKIFES